MSLWFVLIPIIAMAWYFWQAAPDGQKSLGLAPLPIGIAVAIMVMLYWLGPITLNELRLGTVFGWIMLAIDAFAIWLLYMMARAAWALIE